MKENLSNEKLSLEKPKEIEKNKHEINCEKESAFLEYEKNILFALELIDTPSVSYKKEFMENFLNDPFEMVFSFHCPVKPVKNDVIENSWFGPAAFGKDVHVVYVADEHMEKIEEFFSKYMLRKKQPKILPFSEMCLLAENFDEAEDS